MNWNYTQNSAIHVWNIDQIKNYILFVYWGGCCIEVCVRLPSISQTKRKDFRKIVKRLSKNFGWCLLNLYEIWMKLLGVSPAFFLYHFVANFILLFLYIELCGKRWHDSWFLMLFIEMSSIIYRKYTSTNFQTFFIFLAFELKLANMKKVLIFFLLLQSTC